MRSIRILLVGIMMGFLCLTIAESGELADHGGLLRASGSDTERQVNPAGARVPTS
jgi:hypothetical protein